jgi:hypothetical protein
MRDIRRALLASKVVASSSVSQVLLLRTELFDVALYAHRSSDDSMTFCMAKHRERHDEGGRDEGRRDGGTEGRREEASSPEQR